jgi:rhodanese-related sulfurtransferase
MSIRTITVDEARALIEAGGVLIDIRDPDEHAREHIPDARSVPLAEIGQTALPADASVVIFHCRTGNRTAAYADKLASSSACTKYILGGGLDAWKRAGLPVITDRHQPMELMRQVQITAGSLIVATLLLGATISGLFYFAAALIGAGLVFAGVTGTCALAGALRRMPWNRSMASPS